MALGGFRRALRLRDGLVIDHRPPAHPDATGPDWVELDIPRDVPASINELISATAATVVSGHLVIDAVTLEAHRAKVERMRGSPPADRVLLRAVAKRLNVTDDELRAARDELEQKG